MQRKGQTRSLTVEDMRRSLAGPATAVGAALEQVRWLGGVITVRVSVAVLDAPGSRPGRFRLRWTRARPDRVYSLKEPATVATPCSAARLQHAQHSIGQHYATSSAGVAFMCLFLVSPFKLQPLFRTSAFLHIFFILVTYVAVAFANCILHK